MIGKYCQVKMSIVQPSLPDQGIFLYEHENWLLPIFDCQYYDMDYKYIYPEKNAVRGRYILY